MGPLRSGGGMGGNRALEGGAAPGAAVFSANPAPSAALVLPVPGVGGTPGRGGEDGAGPSLHPVGASWRRWERTRSPAFRSPPENKPKYNTINRILGSQSAPASPTPGVGRGAEGAAPGAGRCPEPQLRGAAERPEPGGGSSRAARGRGSRGCYRPHD